MSPSSKLAHARIPRVKFWKARSCKKCKTTVGINALWYTFCTSQTQEIDCRWILFWISLYSRLPWRNRQLSWICWRSSSSRCRTNIADVDEVCSSNRQLCWPLGSRDHRQRSHQELAPSRMAHLLGRWSKSITITILSNNRRTSSRRFLAQEVILTVVHLMFYKMQPFNSLIPPLSEPRWKLFNNISLRNVIMSLKGLTRWVWKLLHPTQLSISGSIVTYTFQKVSNSVVSKLPERIHSGLAFFEACLHEKVIVVPGNSPLSDILICRIIFRYQSQESSWFISFSLSPFHPFVLWSTIGRIEKGSRWNCPSFGKLRSWAKEEGITFPLEMRRNCPWLLDFYLLM